MASSGHPWHIPFVSIDSGRLCARCRSFIVEHEAEDIYPEYLHGPDDLTSRYHSLASGAQINQAQVHISPASLRLSHLRTELVHKAAFSLRQIWIPQP